MGNIDPESAEMKQREHILAKCLQFLRLLARYDELTNSACMITYIICDNHKLLHAYNFGPLPWPRLVTHFILNFHK